MVRACADDVGAALRQLRSPAIFKTIYDIIVVDSGPITASIEALPIASAVDGAILTLRRGRSRSRLAECRKDLKSVGTDYLGVVLNYAGRSDCEHYGSTSKMSEAVSDEIESSGATAPAAKSAPAALQFRGKGHEMKYV